ncbi:MAG: CoA activase [Chitinivibrionales bacterium]|nr:CoA activase [Chitinivibrionales bacterium]
MKLEHLVRKSPENNEVLSVGLDIGSTTVKVVVMDEHNAILARAYTRHHARQPEVVSLLLDEIEAYYSRAMLCIYITGSGGRSLAPYINARYVQEVNAVISAVERLCPDTGSVIELGGQDAKIIIWKRDKEGNATVSSFMNDKCAGGTGATLDRILGKIGISLSEVRKVRAQGKTIHPIAAKCGVFAETDVVGLLKTGIEMEEIVVSLCTAIVKQNLEVLVKGNVLRAPVLLLGGPHAYLNVLTDLWRTWIPSTWQLHHYVPETPSLPESIRVPEGAQYYAAAGAVIFGKESREMLTAFEGSSAKDRRFYYEGRKGLDNYLSHERMKKLGENGSFRNGLVQSEQELDEFVAAYTIPPFKACEPPEGAHITGYLGVDGGSTSSKLVLVDSEGVPLYRDYILSKGNPIIDIREMAARLDRWIKSRNITLRLAGTGVTGYASSILKEAFCFDTVVVETVAHMRSSVHRYGNIDVICDVGGQDIKVLFLKHGRVVDFKLNTQCSAGNGYFLQTMAEQFDVPIEEYATTAFKARRAPAFNYGCAVFMEQDRVNFQQLGWKKEEIMAGLALVLPLNIWNYIVQDTNVSRFGRRIVLQGGTQRNLAAVKAQVDYIKSRNPEAEVIVHDYADICGAIGAALEVRKQRTGRPSSFVGLEKASNLTFVTCNDDSTRCPFCVNKCTRTFIDITVSPDKKIRYISGNGCDRGMADSVEAVKSHDSKIKSVKNTYPNLVNQAAVEAFNEYPFDACPESYFGRSRAGKRKREAVLEKRAAMVVGMPRVLNLYYYAPFFGTYFRALGVGKVVFSDYTSKTLWEEGNKWGAIDPCFPAKVAPAHFHNLLTRKNVTHLCFPCITHLESMVENVVGNNACPIQMGTPEVVHAAFTKDRNMFSEFGVEYWKPLVNMERHNEAADMLYEYFAGPLEVSRQENSWAVTQGYAAMQRYLDSLRTQGAKLLNRLVENEEIGILMIGHPYHHDPGLNHGIPEEFQVRGFPVFCIESLPVTDDFLDPLFKQSPSRRIGDVWRRSFNRNTNIKLWAAKVAARHPNLAVIDLSSFKCGFDAPIYSYIDTILDASEAPHFLFHDIDQNRPRATFAIRIQTIEYFLRLEEKKLKAMKAGSNHVSV